MEYEPGQFLSTTVEKTIAKLLRGHKYRRYLIKTIGIDFLTLTVSIGSLVAIDIVMNGNFVAYGSNTWSYLISNEAKSSSPMCGTFPLDVACQFFRIGEMADEKIYNR